MCGKVDIGFMFGTDRVRKKEFRSGSEEGFMLMDLMSTSWRLCNNGGNELNKTKRRYRTTGHVVR